MAVAKEAFGLSRVHVYFFICNSLLWLYYVLEHIKTIGKLKLVCDATFHIIYFYMKLKEKAVSSLI